MFYELVDGGFIVLVGHIWFSGDGLDEVSAGGEEEGRVYQREAERKKEAEQWEREKAGVMCLKGEFNRYTKT